MSVSPDFTRSNFNFVSDANGNKATEKVTVSGKVYVITVTGVANETEAKAHLKTQANKVVTLAIAYGVGVEGSSTKSIEVKGNNLRVSKENNKDKTVTLKSDDYQIDIKQRTQNIEFKGHQYGAMRAVLNELTDRDLLERIENKTLTEDDVATLRKSFEEVLRNKKAEQKMIDFLAKICTKENWELGKDQIAKKEEKWGKKYGETLQIAALYKGTLPSTNPTFTVAPEKDVPDVPTDKGKSSVEDEDEDNFGVKDVPDPIKRSIDGESSSLPVNPDDEMNRVDE